MAEIITTFDEAKGVIEAKRRRKFSGVLGYGFLLLWSVVMIGFALWAGPRGYGRAKSLGIIALFGFFAIGSLAALFERYRIVIDRTNGVLSCLTRTLREGRQEKELPLESLEYVEVRKEESIVRGAHEGYYWICLGGESEEFVIGQADDRAGALKLAGKISDFIGIGVSEGAEDWRVMGAEDTIADEAAWARKPEDTKAEYRTDESGLVVEIPARGVSWREYTAILVFNIVSLTCLGVGIYAIVGYFRRDESAIGSILFVGMIILLWIMGTTCVQVVRSLRSAWSRSRLRVSKAGLEVVKSLWLMRRRHVIPADELVEIAVLGEGVQSEISLFSLVADRPEVMVRSKGEVVCFGWGLAVEELRWLGSEICRAGLNYREQE